MLSKVQPDVLVVPFLKRELPLSGPRRAALHYTANSFDLGVSSLPPSKAARRQEASAFDPRFLETAV